MIVTYPSTKRTTDLSVGEMVLWYGMFAPSDVFTGNVGLSVGLHSCIISSNVVFYPVIVINMQDSVLSDSLSSKLDSLNPSIRKEVESWIVNSVKVKMIRKLDNILEPEGRINARKLFLTPLFTISEIVKRVETTAPEIKTYFFKVLIATVDEAERKLS